jgi:hypothetical protein
MNILYFECPHCSLQVQVYEHEINCSIFRHGVYKNSGIQMPPHAPQQMCEQLVATDQIYGCGKPFKVVKGESGAYLCEICDYI